MMDEKRSDYFKSDQCILAMDSKSPLSPSMREHILRTITTSQSHLIGYSLSTQGKNEHGTVMITAIFSGSSTKHGPSRDRTDEKEKGKILFCTIVQTR